MNFLTRLIACFLIVWLPILGYPAQASVCPEMSPAVSQRHEGPMAMTGMTHNTNVTKAPAVKMHAGCHGGMGSLSCGMPFVASSQATVAIPSLPVYRPVSRVLAAQFVSEPPQRPPQAL